MEVGPGVTSLEVGDHVIPLYTPECRECEYCLNPKTNLCQSIRSTQGQGLMPDGTSRFSMLDGTPILHYMGCSTFANHTVLPEIALAKVRKDAPFDKICYIGCGVTTGIGAVINTAKVEIGSTAIVFGLGGIGLNVIQGLRLAGADQIVGVDLNPGKKPMAEKFGMTDFVNPEEVEGDLVAHLVELTGGGGDYTFDATGNVGVMRTALESAHKGWGESVIIGVAPAGAEISTRPFQLVTGRVWRGTAFGGARGRTDVPKIVDWYMDGKIEIDPMITHTLCNPADQRPGWQHSWRVLPCLVGIAPKAGAPDAFIGVEPGAPGVLGRIDVAQIRQPGRLHLFCNLFEIERAELVPLGQDHQEIGIFRRIIGIGFPAHARQQGLALAATLRVDHADLRATADHGGDDGQARRVAHVVGIGFEGDAQHRDRPLVEGALGEVHQLVDHAALDLVVDLDDRLGDLHRAGMILPDPCERLGVLGKARAAIAGARMQEGLADPPIQPHDRLADLLHVRAGAFHTGRRSR